MEEEIITMMDQKLLGRRVVENVLIQDALISLLIKKKIITEKDVLKAVEKRAEQVKKVIVKKDKIGKSKKKKEKLERPNYFG